MKRQQIFAVVCFAACFTDFEAQFELVHTDIALLNQIMCVYLLSLIYFRCWNRPIIDTLVDM